MHIKLSSCLLMGSLLALTLAAPTTENPAVSRACSTIVNSPNTSSIFEASLAYECLTSVPFNPAVASKFLSYYNDTIQFQSTLEYLKHPPTSYQQPAVDLLKGLEDLEIAIQANKFPNQYEFEVALQKLLYASHDTHVILLAGVLAVFTFVSPLEIVSLSVDGLQLPKVYLANDVEASNQFNNYQPSPIVSINGEATDAYLSKFASENSFGMLEPHADYNQLMISAAMNTQHYDHLFSGSYYTNDTITFVLENGTAIPPQSLFAIYHKQGNTGPLETGGDFYNFFVLGLLPASFVEELINNNNVNVTSLLQPVHNITEATPITPVFSSTCRSSWNNPAYPICPDIIQENFQTLEDEPGVVSAYFLNDSSIGVLSIISFDLEESYIPSFEATISSFLIRSRDLKLKKLVIDLQSNFGGQTLLAISAFKHFFPNIDPFAGSRLRAHSAADKLGETINYYFQELERINSTSEDVSTLYSNEWVSATRINAETKKEFSSWSEFFGPHPLDGDNFTTTQQYNLSSPRFDDSAVGDEEGNFTVFGYNSTTAAATPLYAAEDIIILSDGACSSACALFMEMMHHEAGVRVVAAGGRPSKGPMQAPSGSRGARMYSTYELDSNIELAQVLRASWNSTEKETYFVPNRTKALDVYVTYASVNIRDQIRPNETIPRQFAYEAADCRIFYTPQTYYNYTSLWKYAADSIWGPRDLCVSGSRGFATTGSNKTDFVGPSPLISKGTTSVETFISHLTPGNTPSPNFGAPSSDGLVAGPPETPSLQDTTTIITCHSTADCRRSVVDSVCAEVRTCTGIGRETKIIRQCLVNCWKDQLRPKNACGNEGGHCSFRKAICNTQNQCAVRTLQDALPLFTPQGKYLSSEVLGVCAPNIGPPGDNSGMACLDRKVFVPISAATMNQIPG